MGKRDCVMSTDFIDRSSAPRTNYGVNGARMAKMTLNELLEFVGVNDKTTLWPHTRCRNKTRPETLNKSNEPQDEQQCYPGPG
eukprot:3296318-Amphidinium_carterae.1